MKILPNLLAACLLSAPVLIVAVPAALAVNTVTARPSTDTMEDLEYKAYAAQLVAVAARKAADTARTKSNTVVGTSTTTKQQRNQAELDAQNAESYANWAESSYDQAEVNAATVSVNAAQSAELRSRRAANDASTIASKARAAASAARAAATAKFSAAPNAPATKRAMTYAAELEKIAYHREFDKAVTAQYQALTQENFTKAKARIIADRAIVAHRGIKGHLSLPLSMPLSKPIQRGPAEVGPRIVGTPAPSRP